MRTTEVIVDGVRSPVLEAGAEGAEEAVVFVHGNPGCGADWTRLLGASGTFSRSATALRRA